MTAHLINSQPYLAKDRVDDLKFPDLITCRLCQGILWLPVACQTCETPYCLSCSQSWLLQSRESPCCPNGCSEYVQRKCPPAFIRILSDLQIICRYKSNGCTEILSYDNVEIHEEACGYQLITCSGCKQKIAKKDFNKHDTQCSLVSLTCNECSTTYQRQYANEHTGNKCLRVQLQKLRNQIIQNEQITNDKISQIQSRMNILMETIKQLRNHDGSIEQIDKSLKILFVD